MSTIEQQQGGDHAAERGSDAQRADAPAQPAGERATETPQPHGSRAEVDETHPPQPTDTDFVRVFKKGAMLGTPLAFVLMGALMLVATPDPAVLLSAAWAALMGGWYFGAMAVLAAYELREQGVRLPWPRRRASA